jgi:predicted transcriptional regulator
VTQQIAVNIYRGDFEGFTDLVSWLLRHANKDEVSRRSGVPKATVYRMSKGKNHTIQNLMAVCRVLFEET